MKKDFELGPDDGSQIELDLTDPVPPHATRRPSLPLSLSPTPVSPARAPSVAAPPSYTAEAPRRRMLGGAGSLVVALLLLGLGAALLAPRLSLFRPRDERFELKHFQREIEMKDGAQYAYHLGAPEGVELELVCDRGIENGKTMWTCTCLEDGTAKRTVRTQRHEPKEAVDIARRARNLCDWPFWADCPRDHWLACKLLPR